MNRLVFGRKGFCSALGFPNSGCCTLSVGCGLILWVDNGALGGSRSRTILRTTSDAVDCCVAEDECSRRHGFASTIVNEGDAKMNSRWLGGHEPLDANSGEGVTPEGLGRLR